MKIIVSTIFRADAVNQLMVAAENSFRHNDPELGFDFLMVRVDNFTLPPKIERVGDSSLLHFYDTITPAYPPMGLIDATLMRAPENASDFRCLHYGAVIFCKPGGITEKRRWGAHLYFRMYPKPGCPEKDVKFLHLDCLETASEKEEERLHTSRELPGSMDLHDDNMELFSLAWVLAWAARDTTIKGRWKYHPKKHAYTKDLADEMAYGFRCFQSGLSALEVLEKKSHGAVKCVHRWLRYSWALATFKDLALPPGFLGVGGDLAKLFEEAKSPVSAS